MSFISKILDAFKLESTRQMENTREMSISEAYAKIDKANKLADIANKTTDREEFYNAIAEIETILTELSKYEHKISFSYSPSANLRDIRRGRNKQIELLERRISEKEKATNISFLAPPEKQNNQNAKKEIFFDVKSEYSENSSDINPQTANDDIMKVDQKDEKIIDETPIPDNTFVLNDNNDSDNDDDVASEDIIEDGQEEAKTIDEPPISDNAFVLDNDENMLESDDSVNDEKTIYDKSPEAPPYHSNRLIISGLHIYFINVAREILEQNAINIIPLMREYKLTEDEINQIIQEMQESNVIDENKNPMMSLEEFERFIDIYEPGLFACKNTLFDKKNFIDIGEIMFDNGVEDVYDILPANEIIDYLNIMENLKIISYDDYTNKYDILVSKEKFYEICKNVPNFKRSKQTTSQAMDIDNMEGHAFEYFCADILSKNGFENVEVTRGSGDHGIDILAEKDDITYAIQCKRYDKPVNNSAVQQAVSGKNLYNRDIAVVLTNHYFTPQATEEAQALGVKLWDRDKLNSMIEKS